MRPEDRFDLFRAATAQTPGSSRAEHAIAVYTVVNVEEWDIEKPVAREYVSSPAGVSDGAQYSQLGLARVRNARGYLAAPGMRWRTQGLQATAAINARVCLRAPETRLPGRCARPAGRSWGTAIAQAAVHTCRSPAGIIRTVFRGSQDYTGRRPQGLAGPGTARNPRHPGPPRGGSVSIRLRLADGRTAGDDENHIGPHGGHALYTGVERSADDGGAPARVSGLAASGSSTSSTGCTRKARASRAVLSMSVHPYIMGAPHRIKYFEAAYDHILGTSDVWFATAEEIYDWFTGQHRLAAWSICRPADMT